LSNPEVASNPYIAPVLEAMSTENRAAPWDAIGAEAAVGVWVSYQPKILSEPDWEKASALFEEANKAMPRSTKRKPSADDLLTNDSSRPRSLLKKCGRERA
jgi:hypothetical protein